MNGKIQSDKELNKIRHACYQNAEEFIKAAKVLTGKKLEHIRYHLGALALEEIGKASLLAMQFVVQQRKQEDTDYTPTLDDHVKKLFWSLWGASWGKENITKQQIETYKGLATTIHEKRLYYLYTDPQNPIVSSQKVSPKEADNIVDLAEARLGMERAHGDIDVNDPSINVEDLDWFLRASEDPEKRRLMFGSKSLEKLTELGYTRRWINWLHGEFKKTEEEIQEIVQKELRRQRPIGAEARKPKWRIKIKIISESHSIRPKPLNEWNKHMDFIQLYPGKDKRELIVQFLLFKSLHVKGLWEIGWGMSRTFVVALNIGARGFFWWNIPKDIARFYEEIWDIENNAGVRPEMSPKLSLNWQDLHLVLDNQDLSTTSLVFFYLTKIRNTELEKPLNRYAFGLSLLAKNDIHLRFEANAFEEFFQSLKSAFQVNGDWDGEEDFKEAVKCQFARLGANLEGIDEFIDLGLELEASPDKKTSKPITLTEVFGIKIYCDVYFNILAKRTAEKENLKKSKSSSKKK